MNVLKEAYCIPQRSDERGQLVGINDPPHLTVCSKRLGLGLRDQGRWVGEVRLICVFRSLRSDDGRGKTEEWRSPGTTGCSGQLGLAQVVQRAGKIGGER